VADVQGEVCVVFEDEGGCVGVARNLGVLAVTVHGFNKSSVQVFRWYGLNYHFNALKWPIHANALPRLILLPSLLLNSSMSSSVQTG
jgi:hypothetical protein